MTDGHALPAHHSMTSPPEIIVVECPKCSERYTDWYRPSINLMIEAFDDDYLEEAGSATCPACGHRTALDVLVVSDDGTWQATRKERRHGG